MYSFDEARKELGFPGDQFQELLDSGGLMHGVHKETGEVIVPESAIRLFYEQYKLKNMKRQDDDQRLIHNLYANGATDERVEGIAKDIDMRREWKPKKVSEAIGGYEFQSPALKAYAERWAADESNDDKDNLTAFNTGTGELHKQLTSDETRTLMNDRIAFNQYIYKKDYLESDQPPNPVTE